MLSDIHHFRDSFTHDSGREIQFISNQSKSNSTKNLKQLGTVLQKLESEGCKYF